MSKARAERTARRNQAMSAILHDIRHGMTGHDAAIRHGVPPQRFWQWCSEYPAYRVRMDAALEARARWRRRAVLAGLRAAKTLKQSAKEAGITVATVHGWRCADPDFDAIVRAAVLKSMKKQKDAAKRQRLKADRQ